MSRALDQLREKADLAMAEAEAAGSAKIAEVLSVMAAEPAQVVAERAWTEATVGDKLLFALANYNAARGRARINANAGPKTLGVIVVPAQMTSAADWEAKGRELAAQGRKVIDTTIGPSEVIHGGLGALRPSPPLEDGPRVTVTAADVVAAPDKEEP